MTTKFFAAIAAMMMTVATMSANNNTKNEASASSDDNTLPNVTVVAKSNKSVEVMYGTDKKAVFNLDGMGRVSTKVSYKKNDLNAWNPVCAYSVFYGETETVLSYAEYDNVRKTFTLNAQQTRYSATDYPEIIRVPNVK